MCSYHCCDPRDEVLERKFYCIVGSRVIKVFSKLIFHGSSIERERATVHTPSADTTFTPFQSHHASSHAALHHRMRHSVPTAMAPAFSHAALHDRMRPSSHVTAPICDGTVPARLFIPTRSDAPLHLLRMAPAFSHVALHDRVCPSSHATAPTADGTQG